MFTENSLRKKMKMMDNILSIFFNWLMPKEKKMDLLALLQDLVVKLQDAQVALEAVAKQKYDEGFAAGVASVGAGDKIYSQVEVDAMLLPLNEKIAQLEAQVAEVPAQIAEAVKLVKQEIAAKIKDAQVDDLALAAELEQA